MTESIKAEILKLPDKEIQPLLEWLRAYYDGEVWDRQMVADIDRLGFEEWESRLGRDRTDVERETALRRVLNAIEPCEDEKRVRFVLDLFFLTRQRVESYWRKPLDDDEPDETD